MALTKEQSTALKGRIVRVVQERDVLTKATLTHELALERNSDPALIAVILKIGEITKTKYSESVVDLDAFIDSLVD